MTAVRTPPRAVPVDLRGRRRWPYLTGFLLAGAGIAATVTWVLVVPALRGPWWTQYTGYGSVSVQDSHVRLAPRTPDGPDDTHAALVLSRRHYEDVTVSATVTTTRQLRAGTPNPWEVGWVLWHETDPQHFYALTLKPNGWELSKQVPGAPGGQQFLASGEDRSFPVGTPYHVQVTQRGGRITAVVDGEPLLDFTDSHPYTTGAVGLYTEDANVSFTQVSVSESRG